MRILVAGITGQLGRGVLEAADDQAVEVVPLVRSLHGRQARARLQRAFPDRPELVDRALEGDVAAPLWGLDEITLDHLAPEVDAVLNLSAETNWATNTRNLLRTNVVGAIGGSRVTAALAQRHPRCAAYCHASSIYCAGDQVGSIPEDRFGPNAARTSYEHSKWLAEEALFDLAGSPAPPIGIARIGGLLGNSMTGQTARRNSLYLLADRIDRVPGRVLPYVPRGRIDMIPRDWAGALLLRFVGSVARSAPSEPVIAHVCAGERAPTTRALFEALESLDLRRRVNRLRLVPLPERVAWRSLSHAQRLVRLPGGWQNALIGLRYTLLDRVFERARIARVVPGPLHAPTAELITRLAFELQEPTPPRPLDDESLGRYAG